MPCLNANLVLYLS